MSLRLGERNHGRELEFAQRMNGKCAAASDAYPSRQVAGSRKSQSSISVTPSTALEGNPAFPIHSPESRTKSDHHRSPSAAKTTSRFAASSIEYSRIIVGAFGPPMCSVTCGLVQTSTASSIFATQMGRMSSRCVFIAVLPRCPLSVRDSLRRTKFGGSDKVT